MDFDDPLDHRVKMKKKKILGSCYRDEEGVEHEGDGDTSYSCGTWNDPQKHEKKKKYKAYLRSVEKLIPSRIESIIKIC